MKSPKLLNQEYANTKLQIQIHFIHLVITSISHKKVKLYNHTTTQAV